MDDVNYVIHEQKYLIHSQIFDTVFINPDVYIQLFQFTLSDQSLKPTRQDRRGIWDLNE